MLEESNETIFQMKDAMYFFFKELQLNMDNWLKSHVIYKIQSKDCPHGDKQNHCRRRYVLLSWMKAAEKPNDW